MSISQTEAINITENINMSVSWLDVAHLRAEFVAGGGGGALGIIVGFPLDSVKIQLQTQPMRYSSAWHAFNDTLSKSGPLGLYKGCLPPIIMQGFINSTMFFGQGLASKVLDKWNPANGNERTAELNCFAAGCFGGWLQCLALVPSEVVKCKMQVLQQESSNSFLKETKQCVNNIYTTEGFRGFYKGFGITALREVPSIGVYFLSYQYMKQRLAQKFDNPANPQYDTLITLVAGGFAGSLSWLPVYPFDVIKTHMQIAPKSQNGASEMGIISMGRHLYKKHGVGVFLKGLSPTLVRAVPTNAVTFYFYEKIKEVFM